MKNSSDIVAGPGGQPCRLYARRNEYALLFLGKVCSIKWTAVSRIGFAALSTITPISFQRSSLTDYHRHVRRVNEIKCDSEAKSAVSLIQDRARSLWNIRCGKPKEKLLLVEVLNSPWVLTYLELQKGTPWWDRVQTVASNAGWESASSQYAGSSIIATWIARSKSLKWRFLS